MPMISSRRISYAVFLALACAMGVSATRAADHGGHSKQAMRMLRDAALVLLKEGNARFQEDKSTHPSADADRRHSTAEEGQAPLVTVLSCSDSRAPVELIFDRGIGELFAIRVAGNVADTDEIATVEYGVGHLGTPLLVVLGHTKCGAVTAVVKGAEVHGLLPQLVDNIVPAAERAKAGGGEEVEVIERAIKENVHQSMADILRRSSIVRQAVEGGTVRMLGAVYDIHTGKVEWLGEHPEQKQILAAWSEGGLDQGPGTTGSRRLTLNSDLPDPASAPHAAGAKVVAKTLPSTKPAEAASDEHAPTAEPDEHASAPAAAKPAPARPSPIPPAAKPVSRPTKAAAVAPKGAVADGH